MRKLYAVARVFGGVTRNHGAFATQKLAKLFVERSYKLMRVEFDWQRINGRLYAIVTDRPNMGAEVYKLDNR